MIILKIITLLKFSNNVKNVTAPIKSDTDFLVGPFRTRDLLKNDSVFDVYKSNPCVKQTTSSSHSHLSKPHTQNFF